MKQATLDLEPPAATTRPRVTTSATETACAAAPASSDEAPCAPIGLCQMTEDDAEALAKPTKAPAGPRSKGARIIALARSLGVQSDAEAAGQLGDVPF